MPREAINEAGADKGREADERRLAGGSEHDIEENKGPESLEVLKTSQHIVNQSQENAAFFKQMEKLNEDVQNEEHISRKSSSSSSNSPSGLNSSRDNNFGEKSNHKQKRWNRIQGVLDSVNDERDEGSSFLLFEWKKLIVS